MSISGFQSNAAVNAISKCVLSLISVENDTLKVITIVNPSIKFK